MSTPPAEPRGRGARLIRVEHGTTHAHTGLSSPVEGTCSSTGVEPGNRMPAGREAGAGVPRPAQLSAERGHGPSTSRSDAATCFIMTAKVAIITFID